MLGQSVGASLKCRPGNQVRFVAGRSYADLSRVVCEVYLAWTWPSVQNRSRAWEKALF